MIRQTLTLSSNSAPLRDERHLNFYHMLSGLQRASQRNHFSEGENAK